MLMSRARSFGSNSIRWRLPMTYAAIALITALVLGGLLLYTLRAYYSDRELAYLERIAALMAPQVERMLSDELSVEEMEAIVSLQSSLSQTRVKLIDTDGELLVDSGPVADRDQVTIRVVREKGEDGQSGPMEPGNIPFVSSFNLIGPVVDNPKPEGAKGTDADSSNIMRYAIWTRQDPLGWITAEDTTRGTSVHQVRVPLLAPDSGEIGVLELSEGPAVGSEILADVAEKGVLAATAGVLLAIGAGIVVSRSISGPVLVLAEVTGRMEQGDLSARVDLDRRDEFGLLGDRFNEMAERIEETVITLKRFVADAAHEINTPITALRTNLELTLDSGLPDDARADLSRALVETSRLETLTRGLLTLARLEATSGTLKRVPVDLNALLRQIIERFASRAEQACITLESELPQSTVELNIDQAQFTRMVDNLLDNALKFTPTDGVVQLGLRQEAHDVRIWVKDSGIGIPADDLSRLYSRFHRGRNAAAYPGNGLGLVITKAIVEDHGGSISVDSSPEGTCFTLTFPGVDASDRES